MTELERALVLLGEELAFPPAPDVSVRVLARVAEPPPRRRRRALVLVVAALAVAIGAAFAVPQARTAILDFFGLRGATVQRVETLPVVPPRTAQALDLGRELEPEELEGALVPSALGPPDAAYVSQEPYGRRVTLVYRPGDGIPESIFTGVGVLVTEFVGEADDALRREAGRRLDQRRARPGGALRRTVARGRPARRHGREPRRLL